jgi:hypothetical protein
MIPRRLFKWSAEGGCIDPADRKRWRRFEEELERIAEQEFAEEMAQADRQREQGRIRQRRYYSRNSSKILKKKAAWWKEHPEERVRRITNGRR